MTWKPIETAPKDGTPVLLCGGETSESIYPDESLATRPVVGFWRDDPASKHGFIVGNWAYAYWDDDWRDSYDGPTHWMPLPDPPKDGPQFRSIEIEWGTVPIDPVRKP